MFTVQVFELFHISERFQKLVEKKVNSEARNKTVGSSGDYGEVGGIGFDCYGHTRLYVQ